VGARRTAAAAVCCSVACAIAFVAAQPPETHDWPLYGGDQNSTHFSPLTQITEANVERLGLAWATDVEAFAGQIEGTPLVVDGTLYGTSPWSVVFAIDARTGRLKWRWDPQIPHQVFATDERGVRTRLGPSLCCGPVNRGVAYHEGKVFVGTLDSRLVALDADTGRQVWSTQVASKADDYSITSAPRVIKGKVITGTSGSEFGVRGFVAAYDVDTGKEAWRFWTVPGDPSLPFENEAMRKAADTWTGAWWKYGGGGTPWDGMAYDPELDLLYIGTGNGSPWPRLLRSPGGGDNLYLCSILALRPDTGEYVWHYQQTPADNWDYASTQPIVLADLTIEGQTRKVLMQAPKNGFFYVIDRATGALISAEPFTKVTWATGIDRETGRPIETPEASYGPEGQRLSPGSDGAHSWHAMAFNPTAGLVYIPGQETTGTYAWDPDFQHQVGRMNTGRRRHACATAAATRAPGPAGGGGRWGPAAGRVPRGVGSRHAEGALAHHLRQAGHHERHTRHGEQPPVPRLERRRVQGLHGRHGQGTVVGAARARLCQSHHVHAGRQAICDGRNGAQRVPGAGPHLHVRRGRDNPHPLDGPGRAAARSVGRVDDGTRAARIQQGGHARRAGAHAGAAAVQWVPFADGGHALPPARAGLARDDGRHGESWDAGDGGAASGGAPLSHETPRHGRAVTSGPDMKKALGAVAPRACGRRDGRARSRYVLSDDDAPGRQRR
jgi:PQQ-dependent dehydrogenase (methanol/ethanol family)